MPQLTTLLHHCLVFAFTANPLLHLLVARCKSSTLTKIYCNFLVSPMLRIMKYLEPGLHWSCMIMINIPTSLDGIESCIIYVSNQTKAKNDKVLNHNS